MREKTALAVHDLSGFGRCSLTVALPILSVMGVQTTCLPTAVLSTHTGGIQGYTFRDLTSDMTAFWRHWQSLGIPFEALYSGYLGSVEQTGIVSQMFDAFKSPACLVLVDPAMADNGKFYPMFDQSMAAGQAALCAKADVVVPNLTEAAFMLEREYKEGPYTKDYLLDICRALCDLGAKKVVLTGVYFKEGELGACCYDGATGAFDTRLTPRVPGAYHGTGDVYASVLLGGLLNGFSLKDSMALAVDFTYECLLRTQSQGTDRRFGVDFERGLPALGRKVMRVEGD